MENSLALATTEPSVRLGNWPFRIIQFVVVSSNDELTRSCELREAIIANWTRQVKKTLVGVATLTVGAFVLSDERASSNALALSRSLSLP